jgi:formylglycine-generating enzyme required for sulfatase activity
MGVFEVTQRQWELVMGNRPSYFSNDTCYAARPVEQVCHKEIRELDRKDAERAPAWPANSAVTAASFMGRLREKTALGNVDLPTEAQWEYACRAGSVSALNSGKNLSDLYACPNMDRVGRYWFNGGDGYKQDDATNRATSAVGSFRPNAWGLYDMHGNVGEWCLDNFGYYAGDASDPIGPSWGVRRVYRGGCWYYGFARDCRSGSRYEGGAPGTHYTGFRVTAGLSQVQTGSLSVVLGPDEAVNAGAQWSVDGGGWRFSGDTAVDLGAGPHTVAYRPVAGYTEPLAHLVTISNKALTTVTATYSPDDPKRYAIIDLLGTNGGAFTVSYLNREPPGGWTDEDRSTRLVMRRVPAGSFTMGSAGAELGREADEFRHPVTIPAAFYIGVFEVTQRQWELVMGNRPGYFNNPAYSATRPVEQVSYYDIREQPDNSDDPAVDWPATGAVNADSFIGGLRAGTGIADIDLPTEEQWEYACRAGAATALNSGTNLTALDLCPEMDVAGRYWFNGGSGYRQHDDPSVATARAGSFLPNAWGLYDMHGNVAEWCLDAYDAYPGAPAIPGQGASVRVIRGGSWSGAAQDCRSAGRDCAAPFSQEVNVGFRIVSPDL